MYKDNTSTSLIGKLRRPLLLQGPIGYFFSNLMEQFIKGGAIPHKINFNGGDRYFTYRNLKNVYDFKGQMNDFGSFLKLFILEKNIDGIVLFGDCRPLHKVAILVAKELGVQTFVFEEGYIRPNYITLEINGVNANSILMNTIQEEITKYKIPGSQIEKEFNESKSIQTTHFHTMKDLTKIAALYWFFLELGKKDYPHYIHLELPRPKERGFLFHRKQP